MHIIHRDQGKSFVANWFIFLKFHSFDNSEVIQNNWWWVHVDDVGFWAVWGTVKVIAKQAMDAEEPSLHLISVQRSHREAAAESPWLR